MTVYRYVSQRKSGLSNCSMRAFGVGTEKKEHRAYRCRSRKFIDDMSQRPQAAGLGLSEEFRACVGAL
jgi:hypothetical protein